MSTLFKYKKEEPKLMLYILKDGEPKAIKFYNKECPYSGTPNGFGGVYETRVDSRHIFLVDDTEDATFFNKIFEFLEWKESADHELQIFLDKNEISIEDIKVLKVSVGEPIEESLDLNWSVL